MSVAYVGLKPCDCRKGVILSTEDVSRVAGFLKHGGTIQTMDTDRVEAVPTRCDVCDPSPVEQQGSLFV